MIKIIAQKFAYLINSLYLCNVNKKHIHFKNSKIMATSVVNRKKLASLYLAIENVKEKSFSPIDNCKDEITDTFAELRDNFHSVLTSSQIDNLNEAESILCDYYDNFDSNSDEESDELLDEVSKLLDSVAPHLTEEQADKWL